MLLKCNSSVNKILFTFIILISLLLSPILSKQTVRADTPVRTPVFGPQGGSATGPELAAAMDIPANLIISASSGSSDIAGAHVYNSSLSGFPVLGNSFASISSGNAANATRPNSEGGLSTILGGLNNSQGNDLYQLTLTLKVPTGTTHWSVDWKFFSEEYPEFVGSPYNDAFLIETPISNFSISGSTINAPNNKAFDPSGKLVTINTTGAVGMSSNNSDGTTYDGSTTKLTTTVPIPPGSTQITIYISVMDLGDSILDTTVLLDNFRFNNQGSSGISNQINVPIRWCILEGSEAQSNPNILISRTGVLNTHTYQPQANLILNSSIPSGFEFEDFGDGKGDDDAMCETGESCSSKLPVIPDTHLSGLFNKTKGYLETNPTSGVENSSDEMNNLFGNCIHVWEYEFSRKNVSASSGSYAINVRGFVFPSGVERIDGLLGLAFIAGNSVIPIGGLFVKDWQATTDDVKQTILAHEIGHTLSLPHFDSDQKNLMYKTYNSTNYNNLTITKSNLDDLNTQAGKAREQARRFVGAQVYPIFIDPPIGDIIYALVGNLPQNESFIDMTMVGYREDKQELSSTLYTITNGPIPNTDRALKYWFLLDKDNNIGTGASSQELSNELGIAVVSEGIDFIFLVNIEINNGASNTIASVKQYINGAFQIISDQSIQPLNEQILLDVIAQGDVVESGFVDHPQSIIGIKLNSSLIGQLENARIQGVTLNANTQEFDISDIKKMSFVLPTYPSCSVSPIVVEPGYSIELNGTNLTPSKAGEVFLGGQQVNSVVIDSEGNTTTPLEIPETIEAGYHLASINLVDSAVAAQCSFYVTHPPVFNTPPTPNVGKEFIVNINETLSFNVQASDSDFEDDVTLDVIDFPTGASFTPSTGNPAVGNFSWSPKIGQEGVYIITFTAMDNNGSSAKPHSIVISVQAPSNQPPSITGPKEVAGQYSDNLSFAISASDPDNPGSDLIFSATGLPDKLSLTDNHNGTATVSGIITVAPGAYSAVITVTDPLGLADANNVSILVTKEDARVTYTGPLMISTGCPTCSDATVPLRATIQDISAVSVDPSFDLNLGNITNATVTFVHRNNFNELICTANVILLDPNDPKTGTATCDWPENIGTSDGIDFRIGILVDGYYARNNSLDDTIVVISKPTTNFITGGGYLTNQSSAGTYAGDQGLKTNFGLNLKFTKKGTNIQGRVNLIVRQDNHVYQIKTTAFSSLIVNMSSAELLAKASIIDITDPAVPISLVGNAIMNVTMKDYGEPGNSDVIGITVWDKSGGLLYSSSWNGVKTIEQVLDGGDIQIHLDSTLPSPMMVEQWYEIFLPLTKH